MIDVVATIIEILKADLTLTALTDKIYGEKIDDNEIENLPSKMISVKSAGGLMVNNTAHKIEPRLEIWCFGEDEYEATILMCAVYDVCKAVKRLEINKTLIHSIAVSGNGMPYEDPDLKIPAMIFYVNVIADDRNYLE